MGKHMVRVEAQNSDEARQLLYLNMLVHSTTPDHSSTGDYITDHSKYPSLAAIDVTQPSPKTSGTCCLA